MVPGEKVTSLTLSQLSNCREIAFSNSDPANIFPVMGLDGLRGDKIFAWRIACLWLLYQRTAASLYLCDELSCCCDLNWSKCLHIVTCHGLNFLDKALIDTENTSSSMIIASPQSQFAITSITAVQSLIVFANVWKVKQNE